MRNSSREKSFLLQREPKWLKDRRGTRRKLPASAASWLYEPKSLTARLRRRCAPRLQVRVLKHSWQRPFVGEARLLDQPVDRRSLIREVRLECNGVAFIAARTIIPAETLSGARRRLSRLGTRPLGEVIFCYPRLRRLDLALSHLQTADWSAAASRNFPVLDNVWGRRTLYSIGGPQLIICEFFLPPVLDDDHV